MNTQLSPEEIQRYKQEMMKMYQAAAQGGSSVNSQKTTATTATAPATVATAPVSSVSETLSRGTPAGAAPPAPAASTAVTAPATQNIEKTRVSSEKPQTNYVRDLPAGAAPPSGDRPAQGTPVPKRTTRFEKPDQSFIERLQNPVPEPEYTGRNARIQTPDTGAISAPAADTNIAPAPKPPAGGTYYPDTGAIGVPNYPGTPDTGPIAATPIAPPTVQVPDTGYIEAPDFSEETTGTGYLRVQVHTANRALPVPDAMLIITEETPLGRKLVHMNITDENGYSDLIPLEVPVYPLDEFPNPEDKPYRDYRLSAFADGYYIVPRIEVPIFANVKSLQSVEMVPLAENTSPLSLFPSDTSGSGTEITSVEFEQS
jgi:hypothetical protein